MDSMSVAPLCGWIQKRICFVIFIVLLVCCIILTVIFFILTVLSITYLYVGIACLGATALLVVVYYVSFRIYKAVKRDRRQESSSETVESSPSRAPTVSLSSPEARAHEYRRLESEIQRLMNELTELQTTTLCNARDLETTRDLVRREYRTVAEWIEGTKTPDEVEVIQLSRLLRHLAARMQTIRTRSERIEASLIMRRLPTHINFTGHQSPPPPYTTYLPHRVTSQQRPHASTHAHTHHVQTAVYHVSAPSYTSDTASTRPPPSEGAPPAYTDIVGIPV